MSMRWHLISTCKCFFYKLPVAEQNGIMDHLYIHVYEIMKRKFELWWSTILPIRVITKLPNTDQSSKGKVKTHTSTNRQNQSTTGKLAKPQWPWLGTRISKEMVGWIRFYGAKPPASLRFKGSGCYYNSIYNNTVAK